MTLNSCLALSGVSVTSSVCSVIRVAPFLKDSEYTIFAGSSATATDAVINKATSIQRNTILLARVCSTARIAALRRCTVHPLFQSNTQRPAGLRAVPCQCERRSPEPGTRCYVHSERRQTKTSIGRDEILQRRHHE